MTAIARELPRGRLHRLRRSLAHDRGLWIGGVLVGLVSLAALLAPPASHRPRATPPRGPSAPPTSPPPPHPAPSHRAC